MHHEPNIIINISQSFLDNATKMNDCFNLNSFSSPKNSAILAPFLLDEKFCLPAS